ncbi:hypothetical protein BESB_059530 [Besnoitia besnoiti]|uniref:Uncharacterized protein n=1 Tax=Besnoitia besnoiti TaxID=94643 RepID=A0A2A9MGG2_BESBE|nr:hypothetical protein BESB_059530 [Besnoitia besnoiti]PFH35066.1 hypothetical protein BESB_059530 [Besnoitia besnoiti]
MEAASHPQPDSAPREGYVVSQEMDCLPSPADHFERALQVPPSVEVVLHKLLDGLDRAVNAWQVQQLFLLQQELSAFHLSLREQSAKLDAEAQRFVKTETTCTSETNNAAKLPLSSLVFSLLIRLVLRSIANRPLFEEAQPPANASDVASSTASTSSSPFFQQIRRFSLLLHVNEERALFSRYPPLPTLEISEEPLSSSSSLSSCTSLHTFLLTAKASLKAKRIAVEQLFSFLHDSELQNLLTPSIQDFAALELVKIDTTLRALLPALRRTATVLADATATEALRASLRPSFYSFALPGQAQTGGESSAGDEARHEEGSAGVLATRLLALWSTSLRRFLQASLGVYVPSSSDKQRALIDLSFVAFSPAEASPHILEAFLAFCSPASARCLDDGAASLLPADAEPRKRRRHHSQDGDGAGEPLASLDILKEVLLCYRDFIASVFHSLEGAWRASGRARPWRVRSEDEGEEAREREDFYATLEEASSLSPSFSAFIEASDSQERRRRTRHSARTHGDAEAEEPQPFLPLHFPGAAGERPSVVDRLLTSSDDPAGLPHLLRLITCLVDALLARAARAVNATGCLAACPLFDAAKAAEKCPSSAKRARARGHAASSNAAGRSAEQAPARAAPVAGGDAGWRGDCEASAEPEKTTLGRERGDDRADEAPGSRETTDWASVEACVPLAFSLCGSFLKLLRLCVDMGPALASVSPGLAPSAGGSGGVEAFVAEATSACLRRCMHLESLASHLRARRGSNAPSCACSATCAYPRTTRLALGFRCAPALVAVAVLCTRPRTFVVDGEALRDEAVEEQLADETEDSPFALPSLFAAMQADEDFRRDVFSVLAFDSKFSFLLYRLPYSLARGALEFLAAHQPNEARRRWPFYVLLSSVRALYEDRQEDGAWLESAIASTCMHQPAAARASQSLCFPTWQGLQEASLSADGDAFSVVDLYRDLLAGASECEDFVPQRLFFLGLARTLAAGPRLEVSNTTLRLQQQLRHTQMRSFPRAVLLDDIALDMLCASLQCALLGRCQGVLEKIDVFEQVIALVERRLTENFAKHRLFALRTLREVARLLPTLLLAEALTRPLFTQFWSLVFRVDSLLFLPLLSLFRGSEGGTSLLDAQQSSSSEPSFSAGLGALLESLSYELLCRYGPSLLTLQPNTAPPDENVFRALSSLLSSRGAEVPTSSSPVAPPPASPPSAAENGLGGSGEPSAERREKELDLKDLLLVLLAFYVQKQQELAAAATQASSACNPMRLSGDSSPRQVGAAAAVAFGPQDGACL